MSDYMDDREFHRVVNEGLVPRVRDSYVCVSLLPENPDHIDANFATELGVMIMLDKPIIVLAKPGQILPAKLELVADKIVHADIGTDEGQALFHEALSDMGIAQED